MAISPSLVTSPASWRLLKMWGKEIKMVGMKSSGENFHMYIILLRLSLPY